MCMCMCVCAQFPLLSFLQVPLRDFFERGGKVLRVGLGVKRKKLNIEGRLEGTLG